MTAPLAATALLATPGFTLPPNTHPTAKVPTRVQVVAKEYYYALSRHVVYSGPAIVEIVDYGEDPHDLRLERVGGTRVYRTPIVQPGAYFDLSVALQPGRYRLWCGVANHRQLGMIATLTVKTSRK